jgi:hypothetical protein
VFDSKSGVIVSDAAAEGRTRLETVQASMQSHAARDRHYRLLTLVCKGPPSPTGEIYLKRRIAR